MSKGFFNSSSKALARPWDGLIQTQWGGSQVKVVRLLCVSSAKAHITLISFPLFTRKTQSPVFRASPILAGQKSVGAKDHSTPPSPSLSLPLFFKMSWHSTSKVSHTYTLLQSICMSVKRLNTPGQISCFFFSGTNIKGKLNVTDVNENWC